MNKEMSLDEMIRQFGELFKAYLTNPTFRNNINLLMKVPIQEKDERNMLQTFHMVADEYLYALTDPAVKKPWKPNILTSDETKDLIFSATPPLKSFCRFGDGELLLAQNKPIGFQEADPKLAIKLQQILSDEGDTCYVGLPKWYYSYSRPKDFQSPGRRWHILTSKICREAMDKYCNRNKTYINAGFISSVYKSGATIQFCEEHYKRIKSFFKGKNLVIFAGENILAKLKYNIFDEATDIKYVSAPRINAFRVFNQIVEIALKFPKDYILCFILGPTATVLAYELSKLGYVAYDIGHMAKDYNAFMNRLPHDSQEMINFFMPD